jgi:RNA recognition motif-containing protein
MKLLVRNLARSTTAPNLEKLFTTYGEVELCEIVLDPATHRSKGFGFVEMAESDGLKALNSLNLTRFENSTIRVKVAVEENEQN